MTRTILYYSSSREDSDFEQRIINDLLEKAGDIPIISITQKPMELGQNICVGDVGASGYNMCRQILIGLYAAKTDLIIAAEADCVYPPDYFTFTPPRLDAMYRCNNLAILKYNQGFFKKDSSTFASVIGRRHYIDLLEAHFASGTGRLWEPLLKSWPKVWGRKFLESYEEFSTEYPCVSFKTGNGMRMQTHTEPDELQALPYWGSAEDFRKKYL